MTEVAENALPRTNLRVVGPRQEFEVRAAEAEGAAVVTFSGYAIRWSDEAEIWDWFWTYTERFRRGAFKKTIAERGPGGNGQIKFKSRHQHYDSISAKLTDLREDATGLRFTAETIDTSTGRDLAEELRQGVIDTVSIGFDAIVEEWDNEEDARTVIEARLYEISAVDWPAYEGARIDSVRSLSAMNGWLENLAGEVREGKVLSEANRSRLAEARDRIQAVLDQGEDLSAGGDETPEPDDPSVEAPLEEDRSSAATLEVELRLRERELEAMSEGGR